MSGDFSCIFLHILKLDRRNPLFDAASRLDTRFFCMRIREIMRKAYYKGRA